MSETVTVGMPPLRSVRKWASEEDLADPEARVLEYHNKDNPYNGIEDRTHFKLLKGTVERLYGLGDDPETMVRRMEYVQYEWVRLVCEALRRRKFDCSGMLFWMYNDCWPANGWSLVDYYGVPKAGWYGMKEGFKPLLAALEPTEEGVTAWLCNDSREARECVVSVRFQPWTGAARWERRFEVQAPANGVARVAEVSAAEIGRDGVLVCEVEASGLTDRAWHFAGIPREMDPPAARLRVAREEGVVRVATDGYARVVTLEGDCDFSDNYFDLLPGEERVVRCSGAGNGKISVSCWNGG